MTDAAYPDEQLLLTARLYYVDGLVQAEVAKLVNVSQAKVSRLLALARERGIVRITVPEYQPRYPKLERQLERRLGLKPAVVIKAEAGAAVEDLRRAVAYFAAPVVAAALTRGTLAIAGGRTMQQLVARMRPPPGPKALTVVQAMGNIDSRVGPYDALELGRTVAHRWGSPFLMLNTPAIVPDCETRDRFLDLESVRTVMEQLAKADVALVGIGTLENSVFQERGVLAADDLDALHRCGAVGEVCGRFYTAKGKECDSPLRDRVVGIELADLRRIKHVIAVVAGGDRQAAIRAAARGGLIKSLVIDQASAEALLRPAKRRPAGSTA